MANPFDWTSLIDPAAALGSKVLGDAVAPSPDLQRAQLDKQAQQFNQQAALYKLGQQQQTRGAALPGMYQTLGYTPEQAAAMTKTYTSTPLPQAPNGSTSTGGSGVGSTVGKAALGAGMSVAPAVIGALAKTGASSIPAATGAFAPTIAGHSMLGAIGGLATNPITIAGAAALAGGLLWKKSQVHPTADKWVQGEQNPFDQTMSNIDKQAQAGQIAPEQAKATKQQNAQNYLAELQAFSQKGAHENAVARQAAQTFRQYYGDPAQYGVQLGF